MECVGVWLAMAPDDRRGLGLKGLPLPAREDGGNGKGGTPTLLGDILGEPGDPEKGVPEVGGEIPPPPLVPWENNLGEEDEVNGGGDAGSSSAGEEGPLEKAGGLILFSFCLLLQNHTLTTSFSMFRLLAT